jgi:hypothetical protein
VLPTVEIDTPIQNLLINSRFAIFGVSCHLERNSYYRHFGASIVVDFPSRPITRYRSLKLRFTGSDYIKDIPFCTFWRFVSPGTKFGRWAL